MVTAFVLINAERKRIIPIAQEILQLTGISEVYSVAGEHDLVAVVRVKENGALAKLVTEDLVNVDGITSTRTMIAFRQYSQFDLERMFSVGQ